MKIKMNREAFAYDGVSLRKYEAGKVYDVRDSLRATLTQNGSATTDLSSETPIIKAEERAAYFAKPRWLR